MEEDFKASIKNYKAYNKTVTLYKHLRLTRK